MLFRARQFEICFPRPAIVMGIVNVTPDSFSDGGKFSTTNAAVKHALKLVDEGAEILDIGGESTRPGAKPVSEPEELRRVIPVIEKLAEKINSRWGETPSSPKSKTPLRRIWGARTYPRFGTARHVSQSESGDGSPHSKSGRRPVLLSIDTMKPTVARAALAAGASIVNDVAANRHDPAMWQIIAEFGAGYICMHAGGSGTGILPVQLHQPTGQASRSSHNKTIVHEVREFFAERLKKMKAAGLTPEQIIFDPGIGFGKTLEQNLQLLAHLESFAKLKRPLLLGVSRKSFIEKFSGANLNERLPASLACATLAVDSGTQIVRTHDVAETVRAVRMAEAILDRQPNVE